MKTKIIAALLLAASFTATAYASEFITAPIGDDYRLTVEGGASGGRVGLIITNAQTDAENIPQDGTPEDGVVFFDEYEVLDGKYNIDVPINTHSGLYRVTAGDESGARLEDILLMYADPEENAQAVSALIEAAKISKQDMTAAAKENRYALQFYLPLTDSVDESEALSAVYDAVSDGSLGENDGAAAADIYRSELIVSALNAGKLKELDEYMAYMNIDDERIEKWYTNASDSFRASVAQRMNGIDIDGADGFKDKLTEMTILQKVQTPDGYTNIVSILNDFSEETGFDDDIVTSKSCSAVAGKTYNSLDALEAALKSAAQSSGQSGSGTGSGGGGSSGGSSGGGHSTPSIEVRPSAEPAKPLDVSYFTDLDNYGWAKEAIGALFKKGIISGRGEGIFAPQDNVTREELVKMLVLAFDLADDTPAEGFSDVSPDAWYAPYITSAVNAGVVNGMGNGTFGVGMVVTRQDTAVMLYRAAAGNVGGETAGTVFSDSAEIADYAADAVARMSAAGVFNGYEDGTFKPASPVTRAEAAAAVYRMMGN